MKLEKLKLKNYRQYRDCNIEFAYQEKEKQITIIQGANGTGKTNILNAITWCLYNKEIHIGDREKGLPIINNLALKGAKPEDILEVTVEADFLDEENERMIFKRVCQVRKTDKAYGFAPIKDTFRVYYQKNGDYKEAEEPELRVGMIAPKEIQEYFFFDGERLNEYFKNPNKENIRKEVFNISQLDLFGKVIDHLKSRNDVYAKELKGISPEADKTKTLLDKAQKDLGEKQNRLAELVKEEDELESMSNEIANELKDYPSVREVRELQEKREQLERDIEIWNRGSKELKQKQLDYFIKNAPLVICYTAICEAERKISEKINRGEIPPKFKRSFIQELLDSGRCICLTDISSKSSARDHVEKVLKECDEIADITEELIEENCKLREMRKTLDSFNASRQKYSEDINNKQNDCDKACKELKIIENKLKNIDDERVQRLERRLEDIKGKRYEKEEEIARRKADIESLKKAVDNYNKEYDSFIRQIEKHNELKNTLIFCKEAIEIAKKAKEEIMDEIRAEIEKKTNQQFFELIWKRQNYKAININEEYNISVLDQNNKESIGTLSAGERQVLALSFMAALNIVSGFDAPIIIDTPLGRISREPKVNIAMNLHKYLRGKQVTLLVTDEEYTEEVRSHIGASVGKEYRIKFQETNEGNKAEVVPYEN